MNHNYKQQPHGSNHPKGRQQQKETWPTDEVFQNARDELKILRERADQAHLRRKEAMNQDDNYEQQPQRSNHPKWRQQQKETWPTEAVFKSAREDLKVLRERADRAFEERKKNRDQDD